MTHLESWWAHAPTVILKLVVILQRHACSQKGRLGVFFRFVFLRFARQAFASGRKDLRHAFAKGVSHFLSHSDETAFFEACCCLAQCKDAGDLGRFSTGCRQALRPQIRRAVRYKCGRDAMEMLFDFISC